MANRNGNRNADYATNVLTSFNQFQFSKKKKNKERKRETEREKMNEMLYLLLISIVNLFWFVISLKRNFCLFFVSNIASIGTCQITYQCLGWACWIYHSTIIAQRFLYVIKIVNIFDYELKILNYLTFFFIF